MQQMVNYALAYAQKGFAVFPIKEKGKTPLIKTGFKGATKDLEQIKRWWADFPYANIGIATGKPSDNIFVIDLDENKDTGISGSQTLKDWEEENEPLPETVASLTGSGGRHLFYKADAKLSVLSRIGILEGIDIRGDGGYIVAPPSIHPNGKSYEWEIQLVDTGIAQANQTVFKLLNQTETPKKFEIAEVVPKGKRNGTLYAMACSLQAKGLSNETILFAVQMENRKKCSPPLCDEEVNLLVNSALTKQKGNLYCTKKQPVPKQFITLKTTKDKNGGKHVIQSIENVETVLELDENLANKISFNTLSYAPYVLGELPWNDDATKREWNNFDDSNLKCYLESNYGLNNDKKIIDALNNVANRHKYNPVIEYLENIQWDGTERISTLLPTYLGVEDTDYQREVMKLFMLGAINRIYNPGCKFDYMPVIVGSQGIGKSTFFKKLAGGTQWYDDNFNTIEGDKATEKLRGMWIVELAELLATKKAKEVESIKAFITSTSDNYRPPYARLTEHRPRVCVFAGTTNNQHFLTDRTGNRRFLPLISNKSNVKRTLFQDEERVANDFKMAWGEALHIFKTENPKLILPDEIQDIVIENQGEFLEEDPRIGLIQGYLNDLADDAVVCTVQIWVEVFGMDTKILDRKTSNELHDILLHSIVGWERVKNKCGGRLMTKKYGTQICYQRIKVQKDFMLITGAEF